MPQSCSVRVAVVREVFGWAMVRTEGRAMVCTGGHGSGIGCWMFRLGATWYVSRCH
jgi:hypothetical protein